MIRQHMIAFLDFLFFSIVFISQIWLNLLVTDRHVWCNMRKLKKKKQTAPHPILPFLFGFLFFFLEKNPLSF